uniref:Solute carrier family 40 member n=1 Tax=Plectus sambesii TaxID=2011161 RepID=A0A914WA28_9BILA
MGPQLKLYCSYAFSSWGDRLWQFALSLVLVQIGGDLRLVAINGFVTCLFVLIFASSIGVWIDKTARLTAARTTLTINNITVTVSATFLLSIFVWKDALENAWNGWLQTILIVSAIFLCSVSTLASLGTKIAITKDWVVAMSDHDRNKLAEMNAMMLRIDLTAMILSPLIAGQLMTSVSVVAGCLFITAWNICSWGVEYWLLNSVYRSAPVLAVKQSPDQALAFISSQNLDLIDPDAPRSADLPQISENKTQRNRCCFTFWGGLRSVVEGWRSYYRQSVFPAAFGLALLYMTVLGFDGITTGFAYSQGLKENMLALARGVGAIVGISGTLLYPRLRAKIGIVRTGLFSFAMELCCLTLPLASIWLPGSPFDPIAYFHGEPLEQNLPPVDGEVTTLVANFNQSEFFNATSNIFSIVEEKSNPSRCSISAFLLGIVLARCGLWMADLAISQTMQESIAEHERGVVNGVQSSMNQLMSMIKDLLVIALPDPRTFGLLIIASWISIFCGYILTSLLVLICSVFACQAQLTARAQADLITNLPDVTFSYSSRVFGGYLKPDSTKQIYYMYLESQRSPDNDPLVMWFEGGPGCSGIGSLFMYNGPFRGNKDGQTLYENVFAWNKLANVLYIESPAPVGFSHFTGNTTIPNDDS